MADYYYALLMDGTDEIEVFIVGNERLLRDFVRTMRIA